MHGPIYQLRLVENSEFSSIDFSVDQNAKFDWLRIANEVVTGSIENTDLSSTVELESSGGNTLPDFLAAGSITLVSERARNAMCQVSDCKISFYPLRVDGIVYHIFFARDVYDCLDRERSKIQTIPGFPNRVMRISRYAFNSALIPPESIFRIPEKSNTTFLTEGAKSRIESVKLLGVKFIDLINPPVDTVIY